MKIALSGSIKFKNHIRSTKAAIEAAGGIALFPNLEENTKDLKQLFEEHFAAFQEADAIYFIFPGGYIGTSCKIELGYAHALKKPIYFSELTNDPTVDTFAHKIVPPEKVTEILSN